MEGSSISFVSGFSSFFFFRYAAPRARSERTKWAVVMSEFALICIYLICIYLNLSLFWHINEGIEEIMADHFHQEMTRNWILVYLRLFLLIVIKDVFLSLISFPNKSKNLMDRTHPWLLWNISALRCGRNVLFCFELKARALSSIKVWNSNLSPRGRIWACWSYEARVFHSVFQLDPGLVRPEKTSI